MRKILLVTVAAIGVAVAPAIAAAAAKPNFVYQDKDPAALTASRTYTVHGTRTSGACVYTHPDIDLPADVEVWQVRDVGIDEKTCTKLVEEGIPAESTQVPESLDSTTKYLGRQGPELLAATTASGYAHAWFENIAGQSLTSDTTYLTWSYSGGCVTSSSSYGDWAWNHGYGWGIVSYDGSRTQTCAQAVGTTWSTFRAGSCYQYYYSVKAIGKSNGSFTGSRSDSATCGPVWEHFQYQKTT